jgi:hypothetical protein
MRPTSVMAADNFWDSRSSSDTSSLVDINLSESTLRQPWTAFWPVKGTGEAMVMWHHSEFPEVVSWQFDANRPFDRPWRKWTRTLKAKKETASLQLPLSGMEADQGRASSSASRGMNKKLTFVSKISNTVMRQE